MHQPETQLTLRLTPQEIFSIDNFIFGSEELDLVVDIFCREAKPDFLYLWGESGVGKTHLSLAISEQLQRNGRQVSYINLRELRHTAQPDVLLSLMQGEVVCVDDFQAISGNSAWEESFFHCFNHLREHQQK